MLRHREKKQRVNLQLSAVTTLINLPSNIKAVQACTKAE